MTTTNQEQGRRMVTLRLPPEDKRRLRLLAAAADQDANATIIELIRLRSEALGLESLLQPAGV